MKSKTLNCMFELISLTDWSNTSVKHIEFWPQALRTSLNLCLNSPDPNLLLWVKELICFYNDAFYDRYQNDFLGIIESHPDENEVRLMLAI